MPGPYRSRARSTSAILAGVNPYLAGPLFSGAERAWNLDLAGAPRDVRQDGDPTSG